ncbi:MAG TPA: DUF3568 family protein [Methylomirabilota bacterium]|nr:DUF3568 family protein [Methylomirabilota bacterium]
MPVGIRAIRLVTLVWATSSLAGGCAALPLAVVGGSVVQAGTGAVVKTGTEYTMSGAAHRTFTVPVNAVRAAVLGAFERAGVDVDRNESSDNGQRVTGHLTHRKLRVDLVPLSPSLTAMTLVVKRNAFFKDRATSSEILEQIEQVLAENPTFARRLHRPPEDIAARPR